MFVAFALTILALFLIPPALQQVILLHLTQGKSTCLGGLGGGAALASTALQVGSVTEPPRGQ